MPSKNEDLFIWDNMDGSKRNYAEISKTQKDKYYLIFVLYVEY